MLGREEMRPPEEGSDAASIKAKQIARVRFLDVYVNKSLYLNNFKKNISPVFMSISVDETRY